MSRAMVDLLLREMDSAWEGFVGALDGLTDDEYHWRPSADACTLRHVVPPDSEDWPGDRVEAGALPPLSSIELKVAHVATCKIMYAEYAFREGRLRWRFADLRVPATLDAMRPYSADAHRVLRGFVDGLSDGDLPALRRTNWGASWPTEKIVWTMIAHDVYHGAQIRTMRAMHRASRAQEAG
jgi:uncharacterized damage-inducible protein DinB